MKTLHDHTIIYDNECPLCHIYTRAFITTGMLDKTGRTAYQQMPPEISGRINQDRARNEIALINKQTGHVVYGLDSLFLVLGNAFPFLRPLFRAKLFKICLLPLYRFISYNRKVIASVRTEKKQLYICEPDFSIRYRISYLVLAWLLTSWILTAYSQLLKGCIPAGSYYREFLICGGQFLFQRFAEPWKNNRQRIHYWGHMITVSLIGALLLLPAFPMHSFFPALGAQIYAGYFLLVAGFMLFEHMRRTRNLGLPLRISIAWVLYRLLVLVMIVWLQ